MSWLRDTNTCSYVLERRFGMIAAIAQCHGLTVITAHLHEFRRVPGLSAEDWRNV